MDAHESCWPGRHNCTEHHRGRPVYVFPRISLFFLRHDHHDRSVHDRVREHRVYDLLMVVIVIEGVYGLFQMTSLFPLTATSIDIVVCPP